MSPVPQTCELVKFSLSGYCLLTTLHVNYSFTLRGKIPYPNSMDCVERVTLLLNNKYTILQLSWTLIFYVQWISVTRTRTSATR